ncbi:MAG: four helix bundle protein [Candidatus Omnitrophica bacterium]|nr:four helix bundle protein [Candidatus Omnitrophota bacterium]
MPEQAVGYKKLRVWQLADKLAHEIFRVTKNFPTQEQFGLTSQLRRGALSVPTNVVEGP